MAEFELTCFAQSGNAYRVALMLELCGAEWSPDFVDFFDGAARTEDFRALNEMAEVPVLRHRARVLSQSGAILMYLSDTLGGFGPRNRDEEYEIFRWLLFDNHKLNGILGPYRFLISVPRVGRTAATSYLWQRLTAALGVLERRLSERKWIMGERPTIADLSLCAYLFFDDEVGLDWGAFPEIGRWLECLKTLKGWKHPYDLMPGHPHEKFQPEPIDWSQDA